MLDAGPDQPQATLLEGPNGVEKPAQAMIARVASEFGVHPLRQLRDIFRMRLGRQKLSAHEYYDLGLYDPAHSRAEQRAFLGQGGINALNLSMNPDSLMETKNLVGNKLVYTARLAERGIATTDTQAFVCKGARRSDAFVLEDAAEIVDFLRHRARYPLFGKPLGGSLSVGSVRIEAAEGDALRLGNGQTVGMETFAADVLAHFPEGYLMQAALSPHPDLARVSGDAIGCLRVVTTHDGTRAAPAYAVWKIPGPGAMSDNFWQAGSMLALVDMAAGKISRCHRGKGPDAETLAHHPESGAALGELVLPFWRESLALAVTAHEVTPDLGICGFDIAITATGPVVLECNDQPNHMLYQYPARRGVAGAELRAIWDAAKPGPRRRRIAAAA